MALYRSGGLPIHACVTPAAAARPDPEYLLNFFNLTYVVAILVAILDAATCQTEPESSPPAEAIPLEAAAAEGEAPAAEIAETTVTTVATDAVKAADTARGGGGFLPRRARGSGKGFVPALRPACPHLRSPRPPDGYDRPEPTSPCLAGRSPR